MSEGRVRLRRRDVVRLVAGREIGQRMRARSFLIGTGLLVVGILAVGVIGRVAGGDGPGVIELGIVGEPSAEVAATYEAVAAGTDRVATVTFFDDVSSARAALGGDVDAVVVPADGQVVFDEDVDDQIVAVVQQGWATLVTQQNLADAGLSPDEATTALTVRPLDAVTLDGDSPESGLGVLTGTLAAIMLFIALQTFGTYVLTGVVEEKTTAVVEVLLARARADQLLAGKVIGIGVVGLAQFTAVVVAGLAALVISGVEVPPEIWSAIPMTVVWFLGGYAFYSTLFAVAGSLVSRQEDAQAAAAPMNYALVGAYLLVFVVGYVPDSTASTVLSLLPPIAPLLMPMRMAAGAATPAEVVLALVLLVASTFVAWKLAGRIYEEVVLRRGSRISWRDATTLLRRH